MSTTTKATTTKATSTMPTSGRATRRQLVRRIAGGVGAGLLVFTMAACSSGRSSGAPSSASKSADTSTDGRTPSAPYTGTDFYRPPDPLPKEPHGTLLRYQPVRSRSGAITFRIMYLSRSVGGRPVAVTGLALLPHDAAPRAGRRLLALAHGTTGVADRCAPSRDGSSAGEIDLMGRWVKAGYVVAATDYEGLGTPGRHPYLVGTSEGRSVLDAALAVRQLPGAHASNKTAIAGYSRGGHASLWANQLARSWAPQLQPIGDFAGAPAASLEVIAKAANALKLAGGFFLLTVAGFHAAYPQADPAQILTPAGLQALKGVDSECVGAFLGSVSKVPGQLFKADPSTVEPWAHLLRANDPGQAKTSDPILIVQSQADNVVPISFSQTVLDGLCAKGQVVERIVLHKGQGHVQAAPDAYALAWAWFEDRVAGRPAPSSCPAG